MPSAVTLRNRIESELVLRPKPRLAPELVSTGIAALDQALGGGIPRAAITEVCGSAFHSSGATSIMLSLLALRTQAGERCALVDASDSLSPASVVQAGIQNSYLLWLRCGGDGRKIKNVKLRLKNLEQAVAAADLLVKSGSFGVICLDLTGIAEDCLLRVPLTSWWRFSSALKNTAIVFMVLAPRPVARNCAGLVLEIGLRSAQWRAGKGEEFLVSRDGPPASFYRPLPCRLELSATVLEARAFAAEARMKIQSAEARFELLTSQGLSLDISRTIGN